MPSWSNNGPDCFRKYARSSFKSSGGTSCTRSIYIKKCIKQKGVANPGHACKCVNIYMLHMRMMLNQGVKGSLIMGHGA